MTPPPKPTRPEDTLNEGHSFVVRMRTEQVDTHRSTLPDLNVDNTAPRLLIRVEHVNRSDISRHHSVEGALGWIRQRMTALLGRPPP